MHTLSTMYIKFSNGNLRKGSLKGTYLNRLNVVNKEQILYIHTYTAKIGIVS